MGRRWPDPLLASLAFQVWISRVPCALPTSPKMPMNRYRVLRTCEVSDERCVFGGALRWPLQHSAGGATRGQWPALRCDDARERLARALLARR